MSETKFTPGPWEAVRSLTCGHLRASHNYQANHKEEWTDADIKLISAAPDLYAACESALVELQFYLDSDAAPKLEAALKKARGE